MKITTFPLYEDREDVTLECILIDEQGELNGQGKRPGVLICPGGGYFDCSDREAEPVALAFSAMGYHTFILRYSTWLDEGQPFESVFSGIEAKPERCHPAPVREVGLAMKHLYNHADEYCLDSSRIAVCGFSAGAHNSAMYGVYWNDPLVTDYVGGAYAPAALILGYPLTDYVFMKENTSFANEMDKAFFAASNTAFFGKAELSEEELVSISPVRLVSKDTPPAYIWATSADQLVPVQHSVRMANALADAGIPFELHIFEEGDHGLSLATQASAVAQSQINVDAQKWVPLVDNWLKKRFALDLPAQTAFEQSVV